MTPSIHTIHAIIVDDHPLFREGVATALQRDADIEIIGQGSTSAEAIALCHELKPDILLLDIGIPGGGIATIEKVLVESPATRVIMLTVNADQVQVRSAFKAGATAYVLKGVAARDLISIFRAVHAGEGYITPSLGAMILSDLARPPRSVKTVNNPLDDLTDREQVILRLISSGLSNREIGQQVHLSEKTVKHYVTAVLQKLHVRNRVEAAAVGRDGNTIANGER